MIWKQEAIEKLRHYDAMRQAQENLSEQIVQTKEEVDEKSLDCLDLQMDRLVRQKELQKALTQVRSWLRTVNRALAALTPEEKLILHRFYIYPERGNIDRLCGELNVEQSSVYRKRDKALKKFTLALYGKTE